eukprot:s1210_g17.t1
MDKNGVFYGYAKDAHTKATKDKTDQLLQCLTDRIVLNSCGYRAIMGDFNALSSDLPQFEVWRKHGFQEIQEVAKAKWNVPIKNTCKGKSVKDMVWVSSELIDKLSEVHVQDWHFADHAVLYGVFKPLGSFVPTPVWYKPHKLPWDQLPNDFAWPDAPGRQQGFAAIFHQMEEQLDQALRQQGQPGLLASQKGRATVTEPKMLYHATAPLKPSRKNEFQIEYHGESFQHHQWCRQLRRVQSYCKLVHKAPANQATVQHVHDLWQAILHAPGFPRGFHKAWLARAHVTPNTPVHLPKCPPDHHTACAIFTDLQIEFQMLEKALLSKRRLAARQRRQEDSNLIFRDVAKPRAMPVQTVVTKHTATVTKVTEDGLTVHYEPAHFCCEQEVSSQHAYLPIQEHTPGVLTLQQEAQVEPGDQVYQDAFLGSKHDVFRAFLTLWDPMWNRHRDTEPSRWDSFVNDLVDQTPLVSETMELAPITAEQWIHSVRAKKSATATGPDGISRLDLLHMPPALTQDLVACVNSFETTQASWPDAALAGHITAVEKSEMASQPKDFRPITVLGVPYRTWASIRAKQCLKFLDKHSPTGLKGNRPGHGTAEIWWGISRDLENAIFLGQPLSGFLTDVCKAFNTLARPIIYACALRFGLPLSLVRTWHSAVNRISRRFIVGGSVSPPAMACTGYPEGDPMSVVAMFCLNLAMHHMVEAAVRPLAVLSFVDNWETQSSSVTAVCRAWTAMEKFAQKVDISLDAGKTLFWAVRPEDRQFLVQQGFQVSHHTADLGGHLNYTRKLTNYTVRCRIAKTKVFWDHLARSSAPNDHKLKAISTVAWPRCLHGIPGVFLGFEHLGKLRSAMMASMKWAKKGASPILQCLLLPPRCDPVYYTMMETFLAFRNNTCHDDACPVLTGLVLSPPKHFDPGPAGVFLTRLHMLGWQWDHHGFVVDHEGLRWNLLDSPLQLLKSRVHHGWAAMLGASICTRKEFEGMAMVDKDLSCSTQSHFAGDGAGLLRTAMNGTFYTRNKQIHAGKVPTKMCPFCDQEDSVQHRVWSCEGFADLRSQMPQESAEFLRT